MSEERFTVYLSGPIEYAENHGAEWRNEFIEAFKDNPDIEIIDPLASSDAVLSNYNIGSVEAYHDLKYSDLDHFRLITQEFIRIDCEAVSKSHIIVAKISRTASGGTSGELTLARWLGVPVVAFCSDEIHEVSGWVQSCPTIILDDLKSSIKFTKDMKREWDAL